MNFPGWCRTTVVASSQVSDQSWTSSDPSGHLRGASPARRDCRRPRVAEPFLKDLRVDLAARAKVVQVVVVVVAGCVVLVVPWQLLVVVVLVSWQPEVMGVGENTMPMTNGTSNAGAAQPPSSWTERELSPHWSPTRVTTRCPRWCRLCVPARYPEPCDADSMRWFDGATWTTHTVDSGEPPPQLGRRSCLGRARPGLFAD